VTVLVGLLSHTLLFRYNHNSGLSQADVNYKGSILNGKYQCTYFCILSCHSSIGSRHCSCIWIRLWSSCSCVHNHRCPWDTRQHLL